MSPAEGVTAWIRADGPRLARYPFAAAAATSSGALFRIVHNRQKRALCKLHNVLIVNLHSLRSAKLHNLRRAWKRLSYVSH